MTAVFEFNLPVPFFSGLAGDPSCSLFPVQAVSGLSIHQVCTCPYHSWPSVPLFFYLVFLSEKDPCNKTALSQKARAIVIVRKLPVQAKNNRHVVDTETGWFPCMKCHMICHDSFTGTLSVSHRVYG